MKGSDWMYLGIGAGALYLFYKLTKPAKDIGEDVSSVTGKFSEVVVDNLDLLNVKKDLSQLGGLFSAYNQQTEENSRALWSWIGNELKTIKEGFPGPTYSQPPMPTISEANKTIRSVGGDTRTLQLPASTIGSVNKGVVTYIPSVKIVPIPQPLKTPSTLFNIVNNPFGQLSGPRTIRN